MGRAKICILCGEDCANKPRVKDAKGQYYCKGCHEQAAVHRRMAADLDDGVGIAGDERAALLGDMPLEPVDTAATGRRCAGCGKALDIAAVICINCGMSAGGEAVATATLKAKKARGGGTSVWPMVIGVISIVWGVLLLLNVGSQLLVAQGGAPAATWWGAAIGALIHSLLIIGGINLTRRRRTGVPQHRTWSIINIVLLASCLTYVAATPVQDSIVLRDGGLAASADELELMRTATIVIAAVQLLWPIFILAWFHRRKVRDEVASW